MDSLSLPLLIISDRMACLFFFQKAILLLRDTQKSYLVCYRIAMFFLFLSCLTIYEYLYQIPLKCTHIKGFLQQNKLVTLSTSDGVIFPCLKMTGAFPEILKLVRL